MNTGEVYFPHSNIVDNLWAVRLNVLKNALTEQGLKTSYISKESTLEKNKIVHFFLQSENDFKNIEWVSDLKFCKKILFLNSLIWFKHGNKISSLLKSFDQVYLESDNDIDLGGAPIKVIPWMQARFSKDKTKNPFVGSLESKPFISGQVFEKSLEDTDWNFFSVNRNEGIVTVNFFEGSVSERIKKSKDPVENEELLQLVLNAKALLFKDLGPDLDFLFLEYIARSGQVAIDEGCTLPENLKSSVLSHGMKTIDDQREALGQILNDFELNMGSKKCVTIEERAVELVKVYSSLF